MKSKEENISVMPVGRYSRLSESTQSVNIENGHSKMRIDSLIAISNALSVSTDAILFGEITYDKEPYYKEFTEIMPDCSDKEKNISCWLPAMQSSSYMISNLKPAIKFLLFKIIYYTHEAITSIVPSSFTFPNPAGIMKLSPFLILCPFTVPSPSSTLILRNG